MDWADGSTHWCQWSSVFFLAASAKLAPYDTLESFKQVKNMKEFQSRIQDAATNEAGLLFIF